MTNYKKKVDFFDSEEGARTEELLKDMVADSAYHTDASYSADNEHYPDNQIPFVAKHMAFLKSHPTTDPQHYVANLRLMTRKR